MSLAVLLQPLLDVRQPLLNGGVDARRQRVIGTGIVHQTALPRAVGAHEAVECLLDIVVDDAAVSRPPDRGGGDQDQQGFIPPEEVLVHFNVAVRKSRGSTTGWGSCFRDSSR